MTFEELKKRQGWTLDQKIDHSLGVIDQFLAKVDGKAYVSFSGGKDSTVLLDLCRIIQPNIKAVFCNTRNEYPEIVKFVRHLKNSEGYNIDIIYPELKPNEVIKKCGFPLISKQVSHRISARKKESYVLGIPTSSKITDTRNNEMIPERYKYLLNVKYDVSDKCCYYLKKKPFHIYNKRYGMFPILGIMACESNMRTMQYVRQGGCNIFNGAKENRSMPLSIWMVDDIWGYIKKRKLKIADIYYDGVERTGCMFCGFGCQMPHDHRFDICYRKYPKMYNYFMEYTNNGVTYKEALHKLLHTCNLHLPDEKVMTIEDCFVMAQNDF